MTYLLIGCCFGLCVFLLQISRRHAERLNALENEVGVRQEWVETFNEYIDARQASLDEVHD